jgi:hypothetical protein
VRAGLVLLRLRLADLLGQRVALGLQLLGARLDVFSLFFQRIEAGNVELVAARARRFATPSMSFLSS